MSGPHSIGRLLQSIALGEDETVAALAHRSGEPRSTLFALIGRLSFAQFVERDAAGRLRAGSACGQLGFAAVGLAPIYSIAEALLPALRDDTDATVVLSAGDDDEQIMLMQRRAPWHLAPFDPEEAMSLDIRAPSRGTIARLALQLRPRAGIAEREAAMGCLACVAAVMTSALQHEWPDIPR
jgi:DNA-binding IclR family transcriptional regulator